MDRCRQMTNETYISVNQLAARYGTHRATIWRWAQNGNFPIPVKLGPGCTRWRSSDVEKWEAQRTGAV